MSWLSGIAGKAEALLERVDQVAATSIHHTGLSTPQRSNVGSTHETSLPYEPTASVAIEKKSHSVSSKPSSSSFTSHNPPSYSPVACPDPPPQTTPTPSSYNAYSKSKSSSVANDDTIFQFLNTPTRPTTNKSTTVKKINKPAPTLTCPLSVHTKYGSDSKVHVETSSPGVGMDGEEMGRREGITGEGREEETTDGGERVEKTVEIGVGEVEGGEGDEVVQSSQSSKTLPKPSLDNAMVTNAQESHVPQSHEQSSMEEDDNVEREGATGERGHTVVGVVQQQPMTVTVKKSESSQLDHQIVSLQRRISDLELENKLLKREVSSLNDELGTVLERVREAEEGVASHRQEAELLREQVMSSEQAIRHLRSHDEDIQATLEARDAQIQVLRKELMESEHRENILTAKLDEQEREKERLLQDANLSSEANNHALNVVKTQLHQTEEQLGHEREACIRTKMEFAERESCLSNQQQQLSDTVTALNRQITILQSKVADSQRAVQSSTRELTQAKRGHEDYKKRATSILQAKEKLITRLQEGGVTGESPGSAHEAHLEQLRVEQEAMKAELETALLQGEGLKEELQEAEEQHNQELTELIQHIRELELGLESEKMLHRVATEDLQRLKVEFEGAREEWERERGTIVALSKEKETEITALRAKVPANHLTSNTELESRLHELTESLIQKQTTLEALSSERHSLKLQLERTEGQLLDARRVNPPSSHTAVKGLDTTAHTNIHPMTSVLPTVDYTHSDNRLRNVRQAMNTVDSFSVRLAVFLRRYPYARLFLLLYMVLLHVWVLIVLLTYSPEAHGPADLHTTDNHL